MLDNYDSFTYNLVQYIEEIVGQEIDVFRNDKISLEEVDVYDTIFLSPGPGVPKDAGILLQLIEKYAESKNIKRKVPLVANQFEVLNESDTKKDDKKQYEESKQVFADIDKSTRGNDTSSSKLDMALKKLEIDGS